jgi:hypothetical protein
LFSRVISLCHTLSLSFGIRSVAATKTPFVPALSTTGSTTGFACESSVPVACKVTASGCADGIAGSLPISAQRSKSE